MKRVLFKLHGGEILRRGRDWMYGGKKKGALLVELGKERVVGCGKPL